MIGDALEVAVVGLMALLIAYPGSLMLLGMARRRSRVSAPRHPVARRRRR